MTINRNEAERVYRNQHLKVGEKHMAPDAGKYNPKRPQELRAPCYVNFDHTPTLFTNVENQGTAESEH